jgi:hypothetical protein
MSPNPLSVFFLQWSFGVRVALGLARRYDSLLCQFDRISVLQIARFHGIGDRGDVERLTQGFPVGLLRDALESLFSPLSFFCGVYAGCLNSDAPPRTGGRIAHHRRPFSQTAFIS